MSTTLVALSPDLSRLVSEGYDVEIRDENLVVHHVPFLNADGDITYGMLVSELTTDGEHTVTPGSHQVRVVGGIPYDHQGAKLTIVLNEASFDYGNGLVASCELSGKRNGEPPANYYDKISNYVDVLGRFARAIDTAVTHTNFPVRELTDVESVFRYHDSASSRAELSAVTIKLRVEKVAIVGLGGTGSYILDLIAKTPIQEIHLFDDDEILAHNAFRAPGAMSIDDLRETPKKVAYLASQYDRLRRGIVAHDLKISADTVHELSEMKFVFLSMDAGPAKRVIVDWLVERAIPFIDCGMGLTRVDNSLRGSIRVTASGDGDAGRLDSRISYVDVDANEYVTNIQTADLNMLNAAMAVLKWKKQMGYYVDRKRESNVAFAIASNQLVNGDLTL